MTEKLNFQYYLVLISLNFSLSNHIRLVAIILKILGLEVCDELHRVLNFIPNLRIRGQVNAY